MMKYALLIFLALPFVLKSQIIQDPVFSLKPALGLNVCQVHGDAYDGYDKPGLFCGVAVNARITERLSFELGFYFSQKGARHNSNPDKGDFSAYRLNLNYLDMPLSLRYMLNSRYFGTIGPSIAYLISYKEVINYTDYSGTYPFKKTEIGVNIGLGAKISGDFSVEVRCSNSIVSVRDYGVVANNAFFPNPVARFFNKGFYNNILTLMVHYKINHRKKNEKRGA